MVLIVVLSVHAGFERNLKDMLLGYAPHARVQSVYQGMGINDWEMLEKEVEALGRVKGAYALVEGYVLLDVKGWNSPVQFRAINDKSDAQVTSLAEMMEIGTADLEPEAGIEGKAIVSKQIADALGLQVGETIRLLASTNLDAVMDVYKVAQQDAAWEVYREPLTAFEKAVAEMFSTEGSFEIVPSEQATEAYRLIQGLVPNEDDAGQPMRGVERQMVEEILAYLDGFERQDQGKDYFSSGTQKLLQEQIDALKNIDLEKADLEGFKGIEELVLPKELEISGIYRDAKRSQGPAVFVSLEIGQELRGLQGVVEAIGVRTEDPYLADEIARSIEAKLGEEWYVVSWMQTHVDQFQLVKTEKIMMSFALSFITLLSAFSIMAVMYTVTLQKRQEIGVMKALGARPSQIVRVFVYQGLVVGVCGAALGVALGLLAIRFREKIVDGLRVVGIDPFPPGFHGMSELPAMVIPAQLVVISVVAVILCLLAALIPALMAAFRDPAKSLRNL